MPVSFEGHPLNDAYICFVDDGLLFFGQGKFFKYSYVSKQIVALPVHLGENVCPVFDKACFIM